MPAHSTLPAGRSAVGTLFGERRCGAPLVFYLSDFFLQHDHPENASCMMLPNTNHFTKLLETASASWCNPHSYSTELIYTHHEDSHARTAAEAPYTQAFPAKMLFIWRLIGASSAVRISIKSGQSLAPYMPHIQQLDYPQYEDRLRQQGIMYLDLHQCLKADFYVAEVGMVPGALTCSAIGLKKN